MLIWVNGPFGGGKTQTAHELRRRLPGSVLCDPELVGFGLHRMMPSGLRGDFQDLSARRQGVLEVLDQTLTRFDGHVIVPMTLVEPSYFEEVVGGLRSKGHRVHHTTLLADRDVVLRRLRERVAGPLLPRWLGQDRVLRRESFAAANLDRCLGGLADPMFAQHLRTDTLSVPQVADRIGAAAGLSLLPQGRSAAVQRLRQAWTSLRHVRFD